MPFRTPHSANEIPSICAVQKWRSSKERSVRSITLVTQLSLDRLDRLACTCSIWNDVISAAVYIPAPMKQEVGSATRELEASSKIQFLHIETESHGLCLLDVVLWMEQDNTAPEHWYPVNSLRNRALAQAESQAVLLLDIDFLPSTTITSFFRTASGFVTLMSLLNQKSVLVVPAFQPASDNTANGSALAKDVVLTGKEALQRSFVSTKILQFAVNTFKPGHGPTNYSKWFSANEPYQIRYADNYEPFVIVHRKFIPWYDERFRGVSRLPIVSDFGYL